MSHPVRDAWIEIKRAWKKCLMILSHPVRDAWIEIENWATMAGQKSTVASREGCVD